MRCLYPECIVSAELTLHACHVIDGDDVLTYRILTSTRIIDPGRLSQSSDVCLEAAKVLLRPRLDVVMPRLGVDAMA